MDYITKKIENETLHPSISMDSMIMFIRVSIDGIAQNVAMHTLEECKQGKEGSINCIELFQTLAKAVIDFFEE